MISLCQIISVLLRCRRVTAIKSGNTIQPISNEKLKANARRAYNDGRRFAEVRSMRLYTDANEVVKTYGIEALRDEIGRGGSSNIRCSRASSSRSRASKRACPDYRVVAAWSGLLIFIGLGAFAVGMAPRNFPRLRKRKRFSPRWRHEPIEGTG
jgi:hypothetical protein